MELYILRHTTAADPHGYAQDADRPLTDAGRKEAAHVGKMLLRIGHKIELALTSPYLRARETAAIVAATLCLEPPEDSGFLLPGGDPTALMAHLSARRANSIMLVGHSPDLPYIISSLCLGEEIGAIDVSKGTLAILEVERPIRKRRAVLKALLPLKVTEKLLSD